MNWEDRDIDDLFRDAANGPVPPFDGDFWSEMEALLPDDGKGVDAVFVNASLSQPVPPYKDAYWKEVQAMLPGKKRRIAAYWWYSAAGVCAFLAALGIITAQRATENSGDKGWSSPSEVHAAKANGAPQHSGSPEGKISSGNTFGQRANLPVGAKATSSHHRIDNLQPAEKMAAPPVAENASQTFDFAAVDLLEKNQTGVSYNMARAPFSCATFPARERKFYVQAGAGLGQSFIKDAPGSEIVHFYSLGAGVQKYAGTMFLSAGLHARVDFAGNVHSNEKVSSGTYRSDVRQLYAIETPLVAAFTFGKNRVGGIITPGFQMGFTGTFISYDHEANVVARGKTSGRMPQSRTLTMEAGFIYARSFSEKWTGGCVIAADVIRPVGDELYSGTNRFLPANGMVFIRREF